MSYANIDGMLRHISDGKISTMESRPIEIKLLFHYWLNSTALTLLARSRNFHCPWCQNHRLSFRHPRAKDEKNPSQKLLELAMRNKDEGFSAVFN
ncbi:MAG: hypothetical protein LM588_00490 [Fervidicoccaceae archaeon]|nr:hypothetical protein [Fervidicoccaceae archaeon]